VRARFNSSVADDKKYILAILRGLNALNQDKLL